jgi:cytochrome c-type biogenesis protein CcmH
MSPVITILAAIGLVAITGAALVSLLRPWGGASVPAWRYALALVLAVAVPFGTVAYYRQAQPPPVPAAATPHSNEDLAQGAAQLAAEMETRPDDVDGWVLLARTYGELERYPEARAALGRALTLAPDDGILHAQLGEILVLEAGGTVTPAAAAEFGRSSADPRSRYYTALGSAQRGETEEAKRRFQSLLDDSPQDAPWRQAVIDALGELGGPAAPAPAAAAPGPGPADVAAASSMSPEDRQAMIRGMVEKLAARLAQHPEDKEGWERLAHAYEVLGEPDKAASARARTTPVRADGPEAEIGRLTQHLAQAPDDAQAWLALAHDDRLLGRDDDARTALKQATEGNPGNRDLLVAYADLLAAGVRNEVLPPELVGVMGRLNLLDPDQTDALWYLGLDAAQHGDRHRATRYWTRLIGLLPKESDERKAVKRRLEALP